MTHNQILENHRQLRERSCFQMAPELALKLMEVLPVDKYPFQTHHNWDGKGYEPYDQSHIVENHVIHFKHKIYDPPYAGMHDRFCEELEKGNFPVVSLESSPGCWHGYVVFDQDDKGEFQVMTRKGSCDRGGCDPSSDFLSRLVGCKKVHCLFLTAIPCDQ